MFHYPDPQKEPFQFNQLVLSAMKKNKAKSGWAREPKVSRHCFYRSAVKKAFLASSPDHVHLSSLSRSLTPSCVLEALHGLDPATSVRPAAPEIQPLLSVQAAGPPWNRPSCHCLPALQAQLECQGLRSAFASLGLLLPDSFNCSLLCTHTPLY